jgi:topoisomerase-4 subunit A
VLFATRGGNGLSCRAGDLVGRTRQGKSFLALDEGDLPLRPAVFGEGLATVFCVSEGGRALAFPLAEVKQLRNGGRGTILMGLDAKESLRQAIVCGAAGVLVRGVGRGSKPVEKLLAGAALAGYAGSRARKGKLLEPRVREATLVLPRPATTGEGR